MTAELMRTKRDALLNWIFAFTTSATRTLKAISRKLGSPWEFYQGTITLVFILVATAFAPHASAQGGCEMCGEWVEPCRAAPSGGCGKQKPADKCDEKALAEAKAEYQREKKTALELYDAADDTLKHSTDGIWKFLSNFGMATYEGTIVKGPLVLKLSMYKTAQLKALKRTLNYLETQELMAGAHAAEVTLETADWAAIGLTLEQMYELKGEIHQANLRMEDAAKMVDQANQSYDKALAALDRVIALERQCNQAKQADQTQKAKKTLDEKAHDLRESWQNNGFLFVDPSTGKIYDAQGALERAKAILSAGQQSYRRTPQLFPVLLMPAAAKRQTVTTQHLKDAIIQTQSGIDSFSAGMDTIINWVKQGDEGRRRIQALTTAIRTGP
jgi:hypothetical protein